MPLDVEQSRAKAEASLEHAGGMLTYDLQNVAQDIIQNSPRTYISRQKQSRKEDAQIANQKAQIDIDTRKDIEDRIELRRKQKEQKAKAKAEAKTSLMQVEIGENSLEQEEQPNRMIMPLDVEQSRA